VFHCGCPSLDTFQYSVWKYQQITTCLCKKFWPNELLNYQVAPESNIDKTCNQWCQLVLKLVLMPLVPCYTIVKEQTNWLENNKLYCQCYRQKSHFNQGTSTYWYGLSPVWRRICTLRDFFSVKRDPHWVHCQGFSPLWDLTCRFKFPFVLKLASQLGQAYGLSPLCRRWCTKNYWNKLII
jgi:hypothetical protein